MALDPKLLEILACPEDKGPLLYFAEDARLSKKAADEGIQPTFSA
jgi:uncharacterized protein YbaR (Trm112 family)